MIIKCCKDCIPPKRHLGCHSNCPEYLKEKQLLEIERIKKRKLKEYILYPGDLQNLTNLNKKLKNVKK